MLDGLLVGFFFGVIVGTAITMYFRIRDLQGVWAYIRENDAALDRLNALADQNQKLLTELVSHNDLQESVDLWKVDSKP